MRFWLALLLFAAGAALAAGPDLERAKVHTELGMAYFARGQVDVALEELSIAVDADAGFAPAWNVLGLVYMELEEPDNARSAFQRALDLAPGDADSLNNYGWFLCQNGAADESLELFSRALANRRFASRDKALFNAGICSVRAGDVDAGQAYLEELRQEQPGFLPLYPWLAEVYFQRQDNERARQYLMRYMQRVRDPDARALLLGYRLFRALGEQAAADDYAFMLLRRFPSSGEAGTVRQLRNDHEH